MTKWFKGSLLSLLALLVCISPALAGYFGGASNPFHPGFRSGEYYSHPFENSTGSMAMVANIEYAEPLYVPTTTTFTKLGFEVTTGAASTHCIAGVYDNANGAPNNKLITGTEQDTSSVAVKESTVSWTASPGWYWMTLVCDGTPTVRASVLTTRPGIFGASSSSANITAEVYRSFTYSTTLPTPFGAVTDSNNTTIPKVWVRL